MTRATAFLALLLAGCDPSGEEAFLAGRSYDACIQVLPACPGLTAGCELDDGRYARVQFPGSFRFLTRADPDSEIEVRMFLVEQKDAGFETLVYWNEPGCSDVYVYDSAGRNLFEEATDNVIIKSATVLEGGQHLIEIITDMQARVDVTVSVIEPESR